jgi:hypothetical protein
MPNFAVPPATALRTAPTQFDDPLRRVALITVLHRRRFLSTLAQRSLRARLRCEARAGAALFRVHYPTLSVGAQRSGADVRRPEAT